MSIYGLQRVVKRKVFRYGLKCACIAGVVLLLAACDDDLTTPLDNREAPLTVNAQFGQQLKVGSLIPPIITRQSETVDSLTVDVDFPVEGDFANLGLEKLDTEDVLEQLEVSSVENLDSSSAFVKQALDSIQGEIIGTHYRLNKEGSYTFTGLQSATFYRISGRMCLSSISDENCSEWAGYEGQALMRVSPPVIDGGIKRHFSGTGYSSHVQLEWQAANNADIYELYRKEQGGSYTLVRDKLSGLQYQDKEVTSNTRYIYKLHACQLVAAKEANCLEIVYPEISVNTLPIISNRKNTIDVVATAGLTDVYIRIESLADHDINLYQLQQVLQDEKYVELASFDELQTGMVPHLYNHLELSGETTYNYRIRACVGRDNNKDNCFRWKSFESTTRGSIGQVVDLAVVPDSITDSSVRLMWTVSSGMTGYVLSYKATTDSVYTGIEQSVSRTTQSQLLSYSIENLAPGTTYQFKVKQCIRVGVCGSDSAILRERTFKTLAAIANVVDLDVTGDNKEDASITLSPANAGNGEVFVIDITDRDGRKIVDDFTADSTPATIPNVPLDYGKAPYIVTVKVCESGRPENCTLEVGREFPLDHLISDLQVMLGEVSSNNYNELTISSSTPLPGNAEYQYYVQGNNRAAYVNPGSSTPITIGNLNPDYNDYTVKVRICSTIKANLCSQYSPDDSQAVRRDLSGYTPVTPPNSGGSDSSTDNTPPSWVTSFDNQAEGGPEMTVDSSPDLPQGSVFKVAVSDSSGDPLDGSPFYGKSPVKVGSTPLPEGTYTFVMDICQDAIRTNCSGNTVIAVITVGSSATTPLSVTTTVTATTSTSVSVSFAPELLSGAHYKYTYTPNEGTAVTSTTTQSAVTVSGLSTANNPYTFTAIMCIGSVCGSGTGVPFSLPISVSRPTITEYTTRPPSVTLAAAPSSRTVYQVEVYASGQTPGTNTPTYTTTGSGSEVSLGNQHFPYNSAPYTIYVKECQSDPYINNCSAADSTVDTMEAYIRSATPVVSVSPVGFYSDHWSHCYIHGCNFETKASLNFSQETGDGLLYHYQVTGTDGSLIEGDVTGDTKVTLGSIIINPAGGNPYSIKSRTCTTDKSICSAYSGPEQFLVKIIFGDGNGEVGAPTVDSFVRNTESTGTLTLSGKAYYTSYEAEIYQALSGTSCDSYGNLIATAEDTGDTIDSMSVSGLSSRNVPYCVRARLCQTGAGVTDNCSAYSNARYISGGSVSAPTIISLTRTSATRSTLQLGGRDTTSSTSYQYSVYRVSGSATDCSSPISTVATGTSTTDSITVTGLDYQNTPYCVEAKVCQTDTINCSASIQKVIPFAPARPAAPVITNVNTSTNPVIVTMQSAPAANWQYQYHLEPGSDDATTGYFSGNSLSLGDLSTDNDPYTLKVRACHQYERSYCGNYGNAQGFTAPLPKSDSKVSFNAWVGISHTTVELADFSVDNYEFYRSRDEDCDLTNYNLCTQGQLNNISHSVRDVTDSALTLSHRAYYSLKDRAQNTLSTVSVSSSKFSPRLEHEVAVLNGTMYLIGGYDEGYKNDVWSSTDGISWVEVTSDAGFPARGSHQVVVFKSNMYLIGGEGQSEKYNDVWRSSNGLNWTRMTSEANFSERSNHQVVVLNNTMYLIGGYDISHKNDVWSSTDGIRWNQVTASASFSARSKHRAVVLGNAMYMIGGHNTSELNDVWSSTNGETWIRKTANAAFSARYSHEVVEYNDKMYLIAGYSNNGTKNDIWSSVNGINWEQQTSDADFSARYYHQVVEFNKTMYLLGGNLGGGAYGRDDLDLNDVWSSIDGVNWTQKTQTPHYPKRDYHQVALADNTMYLIGGAAGFTNHFYNDVWRSTDGISWTEVTSDAAFSPRQGHQVVSLNNTMYLVGGWDGAEKTKGDVWSSTDGLNWTEVTSDADFEGRVAFQVVVYKNNMYLIGGHDSQRNYYNDVWRSSDGVQWTEVTSDAAFPKRSGHVAVIFKDSIYLIGGIGEGNQKLNDVWKSTDGRTWNRVTAHTDFTSGWQQYQAAVTNDKIYLIGGFYNSKQSYVLSSSDGISWTHETLSAAFSGRVGHYVMALNDSLYLFGGYDSSDRRNDVWRSANGRDWYQGITGEFLFK